MLNSYQGPHRLAVRDALLYDIGEPEFIEQCKNEFNYRKDLVFKAHNRDLGVSARNLAALEAYKAGKTSTLDFEVTGG